MGIRGFPRSGHDGLDESADVQFQPVGVVFAEEVADFPTAAIVGSRPQHAGAEDSDGEGTEIDPFPSGSQQRRFHQAADGSVSGAAQRSHRRGGLAGDFGEPSRFRQRGRFPAEADGTEGALPSLQRSVAGQVPREGSHP